MQAPNWTDFLQCSICTSKFNQLDVLPISLSCGHTLCTRCLGKLKTGTCPYDKVAIRPDVATFPTNAALLQLLGHKWDSALALDNAQVKKLDESGQGYYSHAISAILELALFLQPLAEHGITAAITYLTKPMLKKLVTVINCQILESDGQVRAVRSARSIADRTVTELLVMHQNQQQISTLLWTAVRNRGCQFLGPVMQEEALRLILRVLESGNSLSRKNIVLFVVQRLSSDFPQASKTSVGHVVQLLYRASCFNVEKRDDDSSLMQLKEEFRSYECLRREHDGQIIRMAMEAGLRISPEQWSTLLYGDHKHKSDMQSIIDKLIAQGAAASGLSELIVAIGRSQDPYQLSEKVVPHLETIFKVPIGPDKNSEKVEWESFATVMEALLATLHGFSTFMQIQNGRFKTGMCPYLSKPGGCPKGDRCTYAHSEEERDRFRSMVKPVKPTKPRSGEQFCRSNSLRSRSSDLGPIKAHTDTHPSLTNYEVLQSGTTAGPEQHFPNFFRYSGDQLQGLRVAGHRPAPLTAPVLTNQEWHNIPRGVAAMDNTFCASENGLSSYLTNEYVYAKPLSSELQPYSTTVSQAAAVNQVAMNQASLNQAAAVNQAAMNQASLNQAAAVNQAAMNQAAINQAVVNQALSKIDLIRLQHEAVNQSIEASTYPRELLPAPGGYVDPSQYPQRQEWGTYPQLAPDPFSAVPQDPVTQQDGIMVEQQLLSGMEKLEVSGPPSSTYSNSSSSSGYPGDSYPSDTFLHPVSSATLHVVSPATATATTTATSSDSASNTATTKAATSSQDEMQAEIERLREQLRKKEQVILQQQQSTLQHQQQATLQHQQQASLQHQQQATLQHQQQATLQHQQQSTLQQVTLQHQQQATQQQQQQATLQQQQQQQQSAVQFHTASRTVQQPAIAQQYSSNIAPPSASTQYPAVQQQVYNSSMMNASQPSNLLPSSQSYGGPVQYSAMQLQAAAVAAALVGSQQSSSGAYYPAAQPTPPNYPAHWSGGYPHRTITQTTPPNTGFIMSTQQPQPLLDHSDDAMLAAYIQMVEQSKASATGPAYQATPTYNPPAAPHGHYYPR